VSNNKASEIVVASNGSVSVAPYGTALPTDAHTALNAAFVDLGLLTETGVTLVATPAVVDVQAWQRLGPVRRVVTGRTLTAAGVLNQWNQESVSLAFGGGTWTMVSAGSYRYDPPLAGAALKEYSVVVDAQDGATNLRYMIRRAVISDAVTVNLVANAAATLPITFTALEVDDITLAPWGFFSDALEFSLAS
jgi:hypothetical protein